MGEKEKVRTGKRQVRVNGDGTFSIPGDSFITTDLTLAVAVAKVLDEADDARTETADVFSGTGKKGKTKRGQRRGGELVKLTGAELLDGMAIPAVGAPATGGRIARLLGPPPLKLKSGESFRLATRMHWLVPAKDVIRGLADFPIVMGITFLLSLGDGLWWIIAIVWGLALVHQGKYAYHVLKWRARVVVVTSKRLITTAGVLQRKVDDKSIEKIKGFNVVQSFLGRVFGYGHLVIKLTGGTDTEAQEVIRFVPKPYDVYACARGA